MDILEYRTWIIFYLISFTALLWGVFLSTQGVLLWISLTLDIIVMGVNFGFLVGEIRTYRRKGQQLREVLKSDDHTSIITPVRDR